MQDKTCIVTGANAGIGRYTALGLARKGAEVVMVCRDQKRGREAVDWVQSTSGNSQVSLELADLSLVAETRALAWRLTQTHPRIHVLVNNVGAVFPKRSETTEGFERTFALNHLGVFALTTGLIDSLEAGAPSRVVTVSSQVHATSVDFDALQGEDGYVGLAQYRLTKLLNILFTYELARRLESSGVTATTLHPGVVSTGLLEDYSMAQRIENGQPAKPPARRGLFGALANRLSGGGGGMSGISPEAGAKTSVYLASSPEVEGVTGNYIVNCRVAPEAEVARERERH